jgi:TolA-binding protein
MRLSLIPAYGLAALLAVAAAWPHAVHAQVDSREGIALQNQIYQLRQELQGLRDQGGRGGPPQGRFAPAPTGSGNDMVAVLLTRVDAMDDQLRQLRGRIDELQNQMQRQNADLAKRLDDMAFQANARGGSQGGNTFSGPPSDTAPTGQFGDAAPPPGPPSRPPAPPPTGPRVRTPEVAMQEANAALARRDYTTAEQSAREVLTSKTSPRAYDAQLLLAQSLFGQRQYSNAAIAFDDAYAKSKRGSHAQDALLGLANSLTAINEKKAACATLDKLRIEFPQARADLRDGIATTVQRAGCR